MPLGGSGLGDAGVAGDTERRLGVEEPRGADERVEVTGSGGSDGDGAGVGRRTIEFVEAGRGDGDVRVAKEGACRTEGVGAADAAALIEGGCVGVASANANEALRRCTAVSTR